MAVIVVSGQAKDVGKTTLICNILRRFAQFKWAAVKISSHLHSPANTKRLASGSGWNIFEEVSANNDSDTGRFLQAGSLISILVSTEAQALAEACSWLLPHVRKLENAIIESSTGARLLDPDLSLLIVDPGRLEFKASAREQLPRIDALIVREGSGKKLKRSTGLLAGIPAFQSNLSSLDPGVARLVENVLKRS
ncbi:MAG TPA: hypothetical protein VG498_12180 [Terriglobales bacterium]|nr:hypothetical protein [Terriglobales bacterium]